VVSGCVGVLIRGREASSQNHVRKRYMCRHEELVVLGFLLKGLERDSLGQKIHFFEAVSYLDKRAIS